MTETPFYINNHMTIRLEHFIDRCETFEEFERYFSDQLLNEDTQVGTYLESLLVKYDKKAAAVSKDAGMC